MTGLSNIIALVVALILGNCQGATDTEAGLPMEFIVNDARFFPSGLATMRRVLDSNGQPAVHFTLPPEDAGRFGEFTKRHIGEAMEVRVCDTFISKPVIQTALYSRSGVLAGDEVWETITDFLANGCPRTGLSLKFASQNEVFIPSGPVRFQNSVDQYDDLHNATGISIALSPADAEKFADFTKRHLLQKVEMSVCGEVLMAPIMQHVIHDGRILLTGSEAQGTMAKYMANGCP